ncbi:MAG TPA: ABC transporter permease [Gaiellaceae bacterium]|jgi:peptide/nickel transport system permease protein|nr:ABC transporter permease [Gaiellaceae bacterium]
MHYLSTSKVSRRVASFGTALLKLAVTLLVLSAVVFFLTVAPSDPASRMLGPGATPAQVAAFHSEYGLGKPIVVEYFDWLGNVVQGDFGKAYITNEPVWSVIRPRLTRSLPLIALAWLLMAVFGVGLGLLAGLRGGRVDSFLTAGSVGLGAVPEFVAGTLLVTVFAVKLHWLPANSAQAGLVSSPFGAMSAYVLPAITIALVGTVHTMRLTRANARDVAGEAYVRAARLRGLSPARISFRHVLPNAAPPVVGSLALRLAGLFGGMVIAENVFGFPGLGQLLVDSAQAGDVPVVQAIVLITGAAYVIVNLLADGAVLVLTPRRRVSK